MNNIELTYVAKKKFIGTNPRFNYRLDDGEGVLIYIAEGRGRAVINKEKHNLATGTVMFCCNRNILYYKFSESVPAVYYIVRFNFSFNEPLFKETRVFSTKDSTYTLRFDELLNTYIHKCKSPAPKLNATFYCLLGDILSFTEESEPQKQAKLLAEDIHENFLSEIDVRKYSDKTGLSKDRFSVIFKNIYGMPPYKYQLMLKMEEATNLLCHTDLSVGEISKILGFSNSLYFSSAYKKQSGKTPTQVRNHKEQSDSVAAPAARR